MFVLLITFVEPPGALLGAHLEWLSEHHESGRFLVSGPSGEAGGVILVRGDDLGEAEALAASDPFVRGGVATTEVVQFRASQSAPGVSAWLAAARSG